MVWSFLKKLKTELPYDLAISLWGIYPKKTKMGYQKDICTPLLITALFTITKICKQPKYLSMDEWTKKI